MLIACQNGRRMTLKGFSKLLISTKVKAIAATWKLMLRADFAQIQNEVLEQNVFSIRVDHRTLQAQKEEAKKNGDAFLVRRFSRVPEEYVGVISCKEDDDPKIERLKECRSFRKQHFDLVMKMDAIAKEKEN